MDGCKSCIADLQTTNLFVKAKSANDGSGRFKSFLEQSFNRRAVLRLAYGRREGLARHIQYPNQPALIVGASPAPDKFACRHSSKPSETQGHH